MRLDELTPAERREIQRGHFTPATARVAIVGSRAPAVRPDATIRFACHNCTATFSTWSQAELHVDVTRHPRIDAIHEAVPE